MTALQVRKRSATAVATRGVSDLPVTFVTAPSKAECVAAFNKELARVTAHR